MSVLGCLAGGGDDGPGWYGGCWGHGCSCSDVSLQPEGTTNIPLRHNVYATALLIDGYMYEDQRYHHLYN